MQTTLLLFLAKHLVCGAMGGASLGLGLLALDVGSLRTLLGASDDWLIGAFMLFFGLMVTFGGVAVAAGVMTLGRASDE
ncbi:hypothetical protein [Arenibaculum pallidiluteum]|uniref:hypothetical protein n=1 Tax=Arenibaculum pallidiluteum TaxID=2812559 RepID=UPI001A96F9F2|nr:hypothetical protein [Arenibaculum pallidiluteum]